METQTETGTSKKGNGRVRRSNQQQVPGTDDGASTELREKHQRYATRKYQIKALQDEQKEEGEEIIELAEAEGLEELRDEIYVGDEQRVVVTEIQHKAKLKSKLEKLQDDAE